MPSKVKAVKPKKFSQAKATADVQLIFSVYAKNAKGSNVRQCKRCEHLPDCERGKAFQVVQNNINKMKEHLSVKAAG